MQLPEDIWFKNKHIAYGGHLAHGSSVHIGNQLPIPKLCGVVSGNFSFTYYQKFKGGVSQEGVEIFSNHYHFYEIMN